MTHLKVGGVPEHFNLPWHLCIENGIFEDFDITVEWIDFPGGTGAMCQALRNKEIDIAIILTEGIIYDILKGSPSKLYSWYVTSPLIWGIHTASTSFANSIDFYEGKKYAISRYGSGSHLMAYVDANQRGWKLNEEQWVEVNNLDGARNALKENQAQLFLWEKFTTQPLVDNGEFKRIGICPTPWPCFAVAVREEIVQEKEESIQKVIECVQVEANILKSSNDAAEEIAKRYHLKEKNVEEWLSDTFWAENRKIEEEVINKVQDTLVKIGKIDSKEQPNFFIWN